MRLNTYAATAGFIGSIVSLASFAQAQPAPAPAADVAPAPAADGAPAPATTESPATEPAGAEAKISPEARGVIDQMTTAYGQLKSLSIDGKLAARFDVAGKDQKQDSSFKSTFAAPNKFRHELDENLIAGSTGQKIYVYHKRDNAYLTSTLPLAAARFKTEEFPQPQASILREQNPSMALAMSADAGKELLMGIASAEKVADVTIDAKPLTALKLTQADGVSTTVALDPTTKLIRRVTRDLKPYIEQQGVPDVKSAEIVIDYPSVVTSGDAPADDQFAWVPPEGAREASADAPADPAGGGDRPAMQLVGKPAPDFTLDNLAGEKVTLSKLKGSVVVLDFWATWCGPCVASMPNLEKIAKETAADGVKVYAVNQQEDKETVEEFMKSNQFTLTALLDLEGKSGQDYKAQAIPQTVVIGKDGVVKKVLIGAGPDTEQQLRDAIAEAVK